MKRALILFCGCSIIISINAVYAVIEVERVNTTSVGLYEKFEVIINLNGSSYSNPYDPEEIDVTAVFTSPSGKEWNVFGFFDEYQSTPDWKVRFAPNETGEWSYIINATDASGADQSEVHHFTAVPSEHHGWIHVSTENPRYMVHDDGTGFYGVGMYTPWRNSVGTFNQLKQYGANTFAIWNIMYGGIVNDFGIIEEELGRYNQQKCGRIDSLLKISEERNLKCMFCIWPHDLFSNTVWAHQWHQNPYRTICDVVDVYSDETCWEYQKKQYRYLIARFGHSRALGIWEIMNEINGTDGWAAGRISEAREWLEKVDTYFEESDPYRHPTTASRSGGYTEYWADMYDIMDLPNVHVYESQGWPSAYSGNVLRSSMKNYADICSQLWDNFEKPAILGETGWDWVYVDLYSPDYTALYHNAIWASLTNGISMTPLWWTFSEPITVNEKNQMAYFSEFVSDINFIEQSQEHFEISNEDFDLFGMKNDSTAFGWIREVYGLNISGQQFDLNQILDPAIPVYSICYYNPWTGEALDTHIRPHVYNMLRDVTPELDQPYPDLAFKISPGKGGEIPAQLELSADFNQVLNIDTLSVSICCCLMDDHGMFCPEATNTITFTLDGPGTLTGPDEVIARNGAALITYQVSKEIGEAKIYAASPGLLPDTVIIRIKDRFILDDFESYESDMILRYSWDARSGINANLFLESSEVGEGNNSMRLEYGIGNEYRSSAIIEKRIHQSFNGGNYLSFWMKPDNSNREMEIRIYEQSRRYWKHVFNLVSANAAIMEIPLDQFESRDESTPIDLSALSFMRITIKKGDAEYGTGTLYFDNFKFPNRASTEIGATKTNIIPESFVLHQNYPNPFNASTKIEYGLPERSKVKISIYNLTGQWIETLVNKTQEAGKYSSIWTASPTVSSGVFFFKIQTGRYTTIKKCILVK